MPGFLQPPPGQAGTFLGAPLCTDPAQVSTPFAVIGALHGSPYTLRDFGADTINAPTAVRARSARFVSSIGHYDFDLDGVAFGGGPLPFVDCGDVAGSHLDPRAHLERTTTAVRTVLERGAVPVVLGGDDSIVTYVLKAYEGRGPIQVVQIDAHLDYRDEVAGIRDGLSSPMRRASEMAWVERIVHVGLRGVGSARASDVADSRADGNLLVKADALRSHGADWLLQQLPAGGRFFVTIDVDGLDPSIAPGTRATMPGGLLFHEVAPLMRGLSARGAVVGVDVVEYCPALDVNWTTADTVLRLLVNLLGVEAVRTRGGS